MLQGQGEAIEAFIRFDGCSRRVVKIILLRRQLLALAAAGGQLGKDHDHHNDLVLSGLSHELHPSAYCTLAVLLYWRSRGRDPPSIRSCRS